MRVELASKWLRVALIPALLLSSAFVLSGCGDTAQEAQKTGFAPVSPLASDKKALDESKAAMLKDQAQNK